MFGVVQSERTIKGKTSMDERLYPEFCIKRAKNTVSDWYNVSY